MRARSARFFSYLKLEVDVCMSVCMYGVQQKISKIKLVLGPQGWVRGPRGVVLGEWGDQVGLCTLSAHYEHTMRTLSAHHAHTKLTLSAQYEHTKRTLWAHYAHTKCTLCAHYEHTMRTLSKHYVHTICTPELGKYQIAIRYSWFLYISTIRGDK